MEIKYYYPISNSTVTCYLVIMWALIGAFCNWVYDNISLITTLALIIALGLVVCHVYFRTKRGVNIYISIISSLISELSSMIYLLLCISQAVDYIHDEPILGLLPLIITTPFTFGAWLYVIKQPSLVATAISKNWIVVCDGILTLIFVVLGCWLFGLSGYISFLF